MLVLWVESTILRSISYKQINSANSPNRCDIVRQMAEARHRDLQYTCYFCDTHFSDKFSLHKHEHKHFHPLPCGMHKRSYSSKAKLQRHPAGTFSDNVGEMTLMKEMPFSCHFCKKQFRNSRSKIQHERIQHKNKTKPFKCDRCKKQFQTYYEWKMHKRKHVERKSMLCRHCGEKCSSKANKIIHERSHLKKVPFKCRHCPKLFKRKSKRSDHESSKHSINIKCNFCDKRFANTTFRLNHERFDHGVKVKCSFCDVIFHSNEQRLQHEDKIHSSERYKYRCRYCEMKFDDPNQRKAHEMKQHLKAIQCKFCDRTFSDEECMKQHCEKLHVERKCKLCDNVFFKETDLWSHEKDVHRTGPLFIEEKNAQEDENVGSLLKFKCRHCSRKFPSEHKREIHERDIHRVTKKCRYCKETFDDSNKRLRHERQMHVKINCRYCEEFFDCFRKRRSHEKNCCKRNVDDKEDDVVEIPADDEVQVIAQVRPPLPPQTATHAGRQVLLLAAPQETPQFPPQIANALLPVVHHVPTQEQTSQLMPSMNLVQPVANPNQGQLVTTNGGTHLVQSTNNVQCVYTTNASNQVIYIMPQGMTTMNMMNMMPMNNVQPVQTVHSMVQTGYYATLPDKQNDQSTMNGL